jgi:hypothetical protein
MLNDFKMKIYAPIWNKYRPAIIRMLIDSTSEPQVYKLSAHEFKAMNAKQKGGYNFTLQVSKGKALNNIKDSVIAQELLEVLQTSPKATELTLEAPYLIEMDKKFMLHVTKIVEATSEEVSKSN